MKNRYYHRKCEHELVIIDNSFYCEHCDKVLYYDEDQIVKIEDDLNEI